MNNIIVIIFYLGEEYHCEFGCVFSDLNCASTFVLDIATMLNYDFDYTKTHWKYKLKHGEFEIFLLHGKNLIDKIRYKLIFCNGDNQTSKSFTSKDRAIKYISEKCSDIGHSVSNEEILSGIWNIDKSKTYMLFLSMPFYLDKEASNLFNLNTYSTLSEVKAAYKKILQGTYDKLKIKKIDETYQDIINRKHKQYFLSIDKDYFLKHYLKYSDDIFIKNLTNQSHRSTSELVLSIRLKNIRTLLFISLISIICYLVFNRNKVLSITILILYWLMLMSYVWIIINPYNEILNIYKKTKINLQEKELQWFNKKIALCATFALIINGVICFIWIELLYKGITWFK